MLGRAKSSWSRPNKDEIVQYVSRGVNDDSKTVLASVSSNPSSPAKIRSNSSISFTSWGSHASASDIISRNSLLGKPRVKRDRVDSIKFELDDIFAVAAVVVSAVVISFCFLFGLAVREPVVFTIFFSSEAALLVAVVDTEEAFPFLVVVVTGPFVVLLILFVYEGPLYSCAC